MSRRDEKAEDIWRVSLSDCEDGGRRLTFNREGQPVRWRHIIEAWKAGDERADRFGESLLSVPWHAFRWETPPVTVEGLDDAFECVLLDAPELIRPADPSDFAGHFSEDCDVVRFTNLGGDAELVAPPPVTKREAYPHLAAFLRHAPRHQQRALWQAVAEAMEQRVGQRPVWLNTAGAGVPWLHVRLDDRPKYYGHAPYRRI